jgi:hypothetical protein
LSENRRYAWVTANPEVIPKLDNVQIAHVAKNNKRRHGIILIVLTFGARMYSHWILGALDKSPAQELDY